MNELDRSIDDLGGEVYIMYSGDYDSEKYISEWGYAGMETPTNPIAVDSNAKEFNCVLT